MAVTFYEFNGDDYDPIGRVEDGVVVDDTDGRVAKIVERHGTDEDELVTRFDGPMLIAAKG